MVVGGIPTLDLLLLQTGDIPPTLLHSTIRFTYITLILTSQVGMLDLEVVVTQQAVPHRFSYLPTYLMVAVSLLIILSYLLSVEVLRIVTGKQINC